MSYAKKQPFYSVSGSGGGGVVVVVVCVCSVCLGGLKEAQGRGTCFFFCFFFTI